VIDWAGLFGLMGPISMALALLVMGLLSKRLGDVTRAPRYYFGLYVATLLMGIRILARMLNAGRGTEFVRELSNETGWVLLYNGLPALAVTLGLFVAWRYWSWLMAERN
jgi:hypothetical protein